MHLLQDMTWILVDITVAFLGTVMTMFRCTLLTAISHTTSTQQRSDSITINRYLRSQSSPFLLARTSYDMYVKWQSDGDRG